MLPGASRVARRRGRRRRRRRCAQPTHSLITLRPPHPYQQTKVRQVPHARRRRDRRRRDRARAAAALQVTVWRNERALPSVVVAAVAAVGVLS